MEFRPIFMIIGALTATLGCGMFIPALADAQTGHPDWIVFVSAGLITILIGLGLWGSSRRRANGFSVRQAFLMTTLVWVVLSIFGALPFYWSELQLSYTDAFFEAMSGLTTTGATVLTDIDNAPPGIILWRAILEWLGGLGIVVIAVAVLPMLQVGGMQLFKAEAFDTADKILPRATQISGAMTMIYALLTLCCIISYWLAGMGFFDASVHAMTTLATGGFSSKNDSIGHFNSAAIEWVAVLFMILGSLPFLLYFRAVQGNIKGILRDSQVRVFLILLGLLIISAFAYQVLRDIANPMDALRGAAFNVTSVLTGTGFASTDYSSWGHFAVAFFFVIMFIGGCAGSTSCGIKIFRFQVLFEDMKLHVKQLLYPSGIFIKRFNGRPLDDKVSASVMSFVFLYFVAFAVLAVLLSLTGLDPLTALSGAATAISNVGPGLGPEIGPAGNFAGLTVSAKWLICAGMLLGRLELFAVLVLFLPRFWRT